jgi:hypothetical protein
LKSFWVISWSRVLQSSTALGLRDRMSAENWRARIRRAVMKPRSR